MARKRAQKQTVADALKALYPEQATALIQQIQWANLTEDTLHNAPLKMRETCGVDVYEMIENVREWLAQAEQAPPAEPVVVPIEPDPEIIAAEYDSAQED